MEENFWFAEEKIKEFEISIVMGSEWWWLVTTCGYGCVCFGSVAILMVGGCVAFGLVVML